MAKSKICTKCGKRKLFSEFHKHHMGKNGLNSFCKECKKVYNQKYRQTEQGKQSRHEADKRYRQTRKIETAERHKEYRRTIIGRLRQCFSGMKRRCIDPKQKCYNRYGGRGIQCLFKSSDEFVDYVINELKVDPRRLQIDRIDNNGHYEKGNIRFVTCKENCNNK